MITIYGLNENGNIFGFSFTENFNEDLQMYANTPISIVVFATTEDHQISYNLVDYFTNLKDTNIFKTFNDFVGQEVVEYSLTIDAQNYLDNISQ